MNNGIHINPLSGDAGFEAFVRMYEVRGDVHIYTQPIYLCMCLLMGMRLLNNIPSILE